MYKFNIHEFSKEYSKNYEWLYNGGDNISEYYELVEEYDTSFEKHREFIIEFCKYRKDIITSDREAAAFMLTFYDFIAKSKKIS